MIGPQTNHNDQTRISTRPVFAGRLLGGVIGAGAGLAAALIFLPSVTLPPPSELAGRMAAHLRLDTISLTRPASADEGNGLYVPTPDTLFQSAALNTVMVSDSVTSQSSSDDMAILSEADALLYRNIFAAQSMGNMQAADALIEALDDDLLMGHVLFQRYLHPTAWHSTYQELYDWLDEYADHPEAERAHNLAMRRRPQGAQEPREPVGSRGIAGAVESYGFSASPEGSPRDPDVFAADLAGMMYFDNRIRAAERAVELQLERGTIPARGRFLGGLAAWRQGKFPEAAGHFEAVGMDESASPWMRAAGSFWAARAHQEQGDSRAYQIWLNHAAVYPHSFYGLLASAALDVDPDLNWQIPALEARHMSALNNSETARRALALIQVGETRRAAAELKRIHPGADRNFREALIIVAHQANLPDLALRVASAVTDEDGARFDAALYPVPPWEPRGGYDVDPALLHAFMRQESRFDPRAESSAGARGLMQLMPETAEFVAGLSGDSARHSARRLYDPAHNMRLGQAYLSHLMQQSSVDDNLINLAIAYNAGPGNLRRWQRSLSDISSDPLLFIETIPAAETRVFVERVLANYWIYRMRDGLDTPSLTALAGGGEARYAGSAPAEDITARLAQN